MANNYIRPLLEVFQQLDVTQAATGEHLAACIVGANYALYRYGQEELTPTPFSSNETLIPFVFEQDPALDYKVDLGSVSVDAEGLEATLAASLTSTFKVDASDMLVIRHNTGLLASTDGSALIAGLAGAPVQVGDVVYVTDTAGTTPRRRTVTELVGKKLASDVAAGSAFIQATTTPVTFGTANSNDISPVAVATAPYTGAKDTTYVLQCVVAPSAPATTGFKDAQFRVTDTNGVDLAATVTVAANNTEVAIGTKGLKVKFNMTGTKTLTVNDTFSVVCAASKASTTQFDGVKLDAMPVAATFAIAGNINNVEIRRSYTGPIPSDASPDAAWSVSEAGVLMAAGAALYIPARTAGNQMVAFADATGNIYVSYRVLIIPDEDEEIFSIASTADIQEAFGTIAPENDIAYACACCLEGSQTRSFYAVRVRDTDSAAFLAAVKKTESDSSTYSFAPITDDVDVMDTVVEYNATLSQPDVKHWRRTLLGVEAPGEYTAASSDNAGKVLTATFTAADGGNTLVQIPDTLDFSFKAVSVNGTVVTMRSGDKIALTGASQTYVIRRVLSAKEVLLISGPSTAITTAQPITVVKADTPANAVEYIGSVAKRFNTRRALVVWCDKGAVGTVVVANKYLAAELAGLSSAVVPQKSITRTEVASINRATRMYTQYTQNDLDEIASQGVLIVTQDNKKTPCYVRHQLTTEMDKGSLYFEDSCTRNIDNISYALTDALEPFIGQANVTLSALRQIKIVVSNILDEFTADSTDDLVGPSLVRWDNLVIYQDPVFKDRLIIKVNLYLPLPLNNIRLYEMAYIANVTL